MIFTLTVSTAFIANLLNRYPLEVLERFAYPFRIGVMEDTLLALIKIALIQLFVFPVLFTFLALYEKKVSLWQRLTPFVSLLFAIAMPILFAFVIYYTHQYLGTFGEIISRRAFEVSIQQWLMISAISWGLFSFSVLRKPNIN